MLAFERFTHDSDKVKNVEGPLGQVNSIDAVIIGGLVCKCFGFVSKTEAIKIKHHLWHVVVLMSQLNTSAVISHNGLPRMIVVIMRSKLPFVVVEHKGTV